MISEDKGLFMSSIYNSVGMMRVAICGALVIMGIECVAARMPARPSERVENMTAATRTYEHIELDANGVPLIAGTNMKVVELVMAQLAHGWSPEELHFQHPYLTLGQIHAALAYYWDHQQELDADIERRGQFAQAARQKAGPSPLAARLRAQGRLS
jgi:uncharacterized protein (DUF433 family)